ncbi:hypothetical protein [Mesorhizobium qingshengii]|uniref:Uncharacterized protein n=1 Tax=Mesorhizobium qingshengii TaxID=1165689 RepID=A0A1G5UZQ4_9HYPH|nr:hypothetical protein [Mesorhizobium qingshengii]SDA39100.1 hypothetical protein SAMN02927914_00110 [Mesorhizobium qingshengii]
MATIIDLPDIVGWEKCDFDPVVVRTTDRMEGRRTEGVRMPTGYWTASYTPGYLFPRDMGKMDAFMMCAGDDGEFFRGYDVFRPRPILMDAGVPLSGVKAGGGAFDGTAELHTITDSRTVVIYGLPAGFQLSEGDYVEFRQSSQSSSLHRIRLPATADGAGHVTLSIKYGLDTENFTTAAIARFEKPSCLMQIDPGSYKGTKSKTNRRPTFTATEMFP